MPSPKIRNKVFTDHEISTLQNICRVAAERFNEHQALCAKMAQQTTPPEGSMFPTGPAAQRLADQFAAQAKEATAFADLFVDAQTFTVPYTPEDEEDVA